jgi:hypothetical protein
MAGEGHLGFPFCFFVAEGEKLPDTTEGEKKKKFVLSDVKVLSVGLVGKGANQETFFLMKGEDPMANGIELEEMEKEGGEVGASFWDQLRKVFRTEFAETRKAESPAVNRALKSAVAALGKIEDSLPSDAKKALKMLQDCMADGEGAEGPAKKAGDADVTKAIKAAVAALKKVKDLPPEAKKALATLEGLEEEKYGYPEYGYPEYGYPEKSGEEATDMTGGAQGSQPPGAGVNVVAKAADQTGDPELVRKFEALLKSQDGLAVRLEKAEKEAAQAREAKLRADLSQAVHALAAIPAKPEDLIEQLAFLQKADGRADFWLSLLKAMDNQIRESGLFSEVGTSAAPEILTVEDRITKAAPDKVKDEILGMNRSEAEKYLKARRRAIRDQG